MSKWALLKAALVSQKRDCDNRSSIHRFSGFQLIERNTAGKYELRITVAVDAVSSTAQPIISECLSYMEVADCTECTCHITMSNTDPHCCMLDSLQSHDNIQLIEQTLDSIKLRIVHASCIPSQAVFEYWSYKLPSPDGADQVAEQPAPMLHIHTREVKRNSGLSVKDLLSNKLHGVDNTGNICVWPAEPLLLHTLLTVPRYRALVQGGRVLEIGGGMTALAGLGLAVSGLCSSVVVTDGHPDCVKNQSVCIEMCKQGQHSIRIDSCGAVTEPENTEGRQQLQVTAQLLHWAVASNSAHIASVTTTEHGSTLFRTIIASDCLFFKDFHRDLILTLQQLLAPGGVGVFLQPARDGTLLRFVAMCAEMRAFSTEVVEDYNPQASALRREYLANAEALGYSEDIHYPIMLILRHTHEHSSSNDNSAP